MFFYSHKTDIIQFFVISNLRIDFYSGVCADVSLDSSNLFKAKLNLIVVVAFVDPSNRISI